jgi:hypothetical protein
MKNLICLFLFLVCVSFAQAQLSGFARAVQVENTNSATPDFSAWTSGLTLGLGKAKIEAAYLRNLTLGRNGIYTSVSYLLRKKEIGKFTLGVSGLLDGALLPGGDDQNRIIASGMLIAPAIKYSKGYFSVAVVLPVGVGGLKIESNSWRFTLQARGIVNVSWRI